MGYSEEADQREQNRDPRTDDAHAELARLTARAQGLLETDAGAARSLAERARDLARARGDEPALARNLCTLGRARILDRGYAEAGAALLEALSLAEKLGDAALQVDILHGLLRRAFIADDHAAALAHGMRALELSRQLGSRRHEAQAHNDLGLIYGARGDYQGALEHLLAGLEILREQGEENLGSVLNNLGNVYIELGDHLQALEFFRSALGEFRTHRQARGEAIAHGNIGRALGGLGEHAAARDAFELSVRGFEECGDDVYLAPALARLGSAHAALGDDAAARAAFDRALRTLEDTGRGEFGDEVLLAAGRFHRERGETDRAVALLTRALSRLPAAEVTQRAYELHRTLADAFEALDDPAAALRHFKEFHRIRQAVADGAATLRIRGLMLRFDVERARQQEEIYRLRNIELVRANEELRALHEELEARNRELQQISVEDALTGLHNRRYLDAQLEHEIGRSVRRQRPLCVALCDIDHFKRINDRLSHAVGDEVLRVVGRLFRGTVRQEDVVARYGGEEFVVVLPETDLEGAVVLIERLRATVAAYPWHEVHPELKVTLSIGLAALADRTTPEQLLAAADERLYQAKRSGRDRVCR